MEKGKRNEAIMGETREGGSLGEGGKQEGVALAKEGNERGWPWRRWKRESGHYGLKLYEIDTFISKT